MLNQTFLDNPLRDWLPDPAAADVRLAGWKAAS